MAIHDVHIEMTYHAKCIQHLSYLLEKVNEKKASEVIQNALQGKMMHMSLFQNIKKPKII